MDFIQRHRNKFPSRAPLAFLLYLCDTYSEKDFSGEEIIRLLECWTAGRTDYKNEQQIMLYRKAREDRKDGTACTTDGRDVTPPEMGGAPEGFTKEGGSFAVPLKTDVAFPGQDYDKQSETDAELLTRLANRPSWSHRKKQLLGIVATLEMLEGFAEGYEVPPTTPKTCLCMVKHTLGSAYQKPGPQHHDNCPEWREA